MWELGIAHCENYTSLYVSYNLHAILHVGTKNELLLLLLRVQCMLDSANAVDQTNNYTTCRTGRAARVPCDSHVKD